MGLPKIVPSKQWHPVVPRAEIQRENFVGNPDFVQATLNFVKLILNSYEIEKKLMKKGVGGNETTIYNTLKFATTYLNAVGVRAANIYGFETNFRPLANQFFQVLFDIANKLHDLGKSHEAVVLLAKYAETDNGIAYDPSQVERLEPWDKSSCGFAYEELSWAERTFEELRGGLGDDNLACHAIFECTLSTTVDNNILKPTRDETGDYFFLRGEDKSFSSIDVDIYCDAVQRETIHLTPNPGGTFLSGPIALCGENAQTLLKWRAKPSPGYCLEGLGVRVLSKQPKIARLEPKTVEPASVNPPLQYICLKRTRAYMMPDGSVSASARGTCNSDADVLYLKNLAIERTIIPKTCDYGQWVETESNPVTIRCIDGAFRTYFEGYCGEN